MIVISFPLVIPNFTRCCLSPQMLLRKASSSSLLPAAPTWRSCPHPVSPVCSLGSELLLGCTTAQPEQPQSCHPDSFVFLLSSDGCQCFCGKKSFQKLSVTPLTMSRHMTAWSSQLASLFEVSSSCNFLG